MQHLHLHILVFSAKVVKISHLVFDNCMALGSLKFYTYVNIAFSMLYYLVPSSLPPAAFLYSFFTQSYWCSEGCLSCTIP